MLTDGEIIAHIEDAERNSYGLNDGQLSAERSEALDYFYGRNFGNEVEGRSQVVSHDVKDTVMWVMPSLMKVFASGDEVVRFDPKSAEDGEAAEQETAYVNHLVMERNPGFQIFYSWFFDALLSKTGYVKTYHETSKETERQTYQGLADEEMALLLQDKAVKPIAHTQYMDEFGTTYHDLTVEIEEEHGHICVENVAPEDIMVGYDVTGTSVREAYFVEQRSMQTISQLREMGFDVSDTISSDSADRYSEESFSRDQFGEFEDENGKGPNRRVLVKEVYIRLDLDDSGISKLHRFIVVGNTILDKCECDRIPYAVICPVPMPHRHVGLSMADLVKDLQLIKSTLLRNALDAQYASIRGRYAISDRVNLDDMLVSRIDGVVRVDGEPAGSIMPLVNPVDGTKNLGMIEYIDQIRQTRTGVTDSFQGMDVNALNKTASGTSQLMQAAQSRVELIARIFAETGVKDLFLLVHELVRKHANKEEIFKLRNKWVPVDPRTWQTRKDMTVSVGLGTGNKDQMLQHLMIILQAQREAIQIGVATPKNIYNALAKLTQNAGFKEVEEFWTDPETQQQKPPQPSPEQIKAQADMQKAQMDNQAKQMQMQADFQLERERFAQEMQLAREKMGQEIQMAREKMLAELEIKRESMAGEIMVSREQIQADMVKHSHSLHNQSEMARQKVDSQPGIE